MYQVGARDLSMGRGAEHVMRRSVLVLVSGKCGLMLNERRHWVECAYPVNGGDLWNRHYEGRIADACACVYRHRTICTHPVLMETHQAEVGSNLWERAGHGAEVEDKYSF